jgi:hypothetical protein
MVDEWHDDAYPTVESTNDIMMHIQRWRNPANARPMAWWWGASNGRYEAKGQRMDDLCTSNGLDATNDQRIAWCPRALSKNRRHNWQSES